MSLEDAAGVHEHGDDYSEWFNELRAMEGEVSD